jgi:hypothetical protein
VNEVISQIRWSRMVRAGHRWDQSRGLCRLGGPLGGGRRRVAHGLEQRHHVGGRLGAAILAALFERGWLLRTRRGRALVLTDQGLDRLDEQLNLSELLS